MSRRRAANMSAALTLTTSQPRRALAAKLTSPWAPPHIMALSMAPLFVSLARPPHDTARVWGHQCCWSGKNPDWRTRSPKLPPLPIRQRPSPLTQLCMPGKSVSVRIVRGGSRVQLRVHIHWRLGRHPPARRLHAPLQFGSAELACQRPTPRLESRGCVVRVAQLLHPVAHAWQWRAGRGRRLPPCSPCCCHSGAGAVACGPAAACNRDVQAGGVAALDSRRACAPQAQRPHSDRLRHRRVAPGGGEGDAAQLAFLDCAAAGRGAG